MATITIPAGACPEIITFASYQHNGTILPYEDQKLFDFISAWYGPGTHQIGPLKIACNFQTDLYFGNVVPVWPSLGAIVIPGPGVGGSVYMAANAVEHQVCAPPPSSSDKLSCSITFNKNPIDKGGETVIHWSSTSAQLFYINTIGYVGASGSASVVPSGTTDFSDYVNDKADGTGDAVSCPGILTVSGSSACPPGQTLVNGQCAAQSSCPVGYDWNGTQCVFSACPSGYVQQGNQCVLQGQCGTPPVCQGNDFVNSCTGAVIQSCSYGCITVGGSDACRFIPTPSATLQATPSLVHSNDTTVVSWTSQSVTSCTVHGTNGDSWTGVQPQAKLPLRYSAKQYTRSIALHFPVPCLRPSTSKPSSTSFQCSMSSK